MKVLVTGAAGFIGSYLCRELLCRGDDVTGYDNFQEYYPRKCKEFNVDLINTSARGNSLEYFPSQTIYPIYNQLLKYEGRKAKDIKAGDFDFIEGDITNFDLLEFIFEKEKFDAVVHLAAMAGVPFSIRDPRLYTSVNVDGTINLLNLSVVNNISNFVFASSSSVYGNIKDIPFSEDKIENKTISPYAATKLSGEILCHTFHHNFSLPTTCLRFFTVYGPLQRPYGMVIQRFINQAIHDKPLTVYGDGTMARDYTYVSDTVSGIIGAIDKKLEYEVINLGNSSPVKLNELVKVIEKALNKKVEVNNLERPSTEVDITYADVSKANKILGYNPKIDIAEGVRRQVEVLMMMPDWYRDLENV
jgi:UDP-glucuronate 4-epimerase